MKEIDDLITLYEELITAKAYTDNGKLTSEAEIDILPNKLYYAIWTDNVEHTSHSSYFNIVEFSPKNYKLVLDPNVEIMPDGLNIFLADSNYCQRVPTHSAERGSYYGGFKKASYKQHIIPVNLNDIKEICYNQLYTWKKYKAYMHEKAIGKIKDPNSTMMDVLCAFGDL